MWTTRKVNNTFHIVAEDNQPAEEANSLSKLG